VSKNGTAPIVELREISKAYGGVRALEGVSLEVLPGEVHALLGENGAGKSTLMKCLAGAVRPDEGTILIDSEPVTFDDPGDAIDAGIGVVYQELSLFPSLTVAENVLGRHALGSTWLRWGAMRRQTSSVFREMGLSIDPSALVEQLPVGVQQMVEIARALNSGARVIVLDEPTSALSPAEVGVLFRLVRQLTERGVTFILVTHFLEDVMEHADTATVLKNGRLVRSLPVAATSKVELIRSMVGDEADVLRSTYEGGGVRLPARSTEPVVLDAKGVRRPPSIEDFSLQIRAGELVGIYGDLASGHADFAEMLFGVARPTAGTMEVAGQKYLPENTTQAREAGVGFIPGDRRRALALEQPIYKNVTLAHLHRTQGWFLRTDRETAVAARLIDELNIANGRPELEVGALSGGNQQKVLFARWLEQRPKVLVLVEPTRGMDVGAKSEVIRIIKRLSDEGTAVIAISSEPETILAVARRVLVAKRGRIVAEFANCELTKDMLLEEAT
jgi:ribose transport system ATP-binding protein